MRIDAPDLAADGEFPVRAFAYFGKADATIELGGAVKLADLTDADADRLIRAACAVKEANAAKRAEIAAPHKYFKAGARCLTCGKPQDDELHAEPKPPAVSDSTIEQARLMAEDIAAATWPPKPDANPPRYVAPELVEVPHCGAEAGGYTCNAQEGHDGPDHVAYGSKGSECHRWPVRAALRMTTLKPLAAS